MSGRLFFYVFKGELKCVSYCTQWDLLSRVSGEQEHQHGQARDEHTGDEQVEAVVQSPAAHGDCERHIWVRLLTALVVQLVALSWNTWGTNEGEWYKVDQIPKKEKKIGKKN